MTNYSFIKQLLEVIPIPVFYKDKEHRYIGCNQAFCGFLGKAREDIINKSVFDVAPKELAELYKKADDAIFESESVQIYEAKVQTPNGKRDVIFNKNVYYDDKNQVIGLIGAIVDITELRAAEQETAENHTSTNETFHQLSEQLLHDIRSPLAALSMVSELVDTKPSQIISQCTQRIDNLISDLKEHKNGQLTDFISNELIVSKLIEDIFEQKKVEYKKNKNIEIILVNELEDEVTVALNESNFQRSLSNLINNSKEAIGSNKGTIEIRLKHDNEKLKVTVSDNGKGIPSHIISQLGHRGKTFEKENGKGLGLYFTNKTVRDAQGMMIINSQEGSGTQIDLVLPVQ